MFIVNLILQAHRCATDIHVVATMHTSGFSNAPISRLLVLATVVSSIFTTLSDSKVFFYINIEPHFWTYHQFWRVFVWQLAYANSTEVLFAAMAFYNLRIIERMWGTKKFAVCTRNPSLVPVPSNL